jgi:hypothetical protein
MADRCRHSAYLTILSFDQFQGNPTIRDIFPVSDRRFPRRHKRLWIQDGNDGRERGVTLDSHSFG